MHACHKLAHLPCSKCQSNIEELKIQGMEACNTGDTAPTFIYLRTDWHFNYTESDSLCLL